MSNRKANKGRKVHRAEPVTKVTAETPGLEIELIPEDETIDPAGEFAAGDDAAADREMVAEILRRLRSGDVWAWFCAHVRVTFDGLTGDDYLGACSYDNEADFRNGGYFDDMVSYALNDLNAKIAKRDHFAACAHCAAVSKGANLPSPTHA